MKFLIDENLSPEVSVIFRNSGLEAYHVNELKAYKNQRVKDDQLRHLALFKQYIIVTKDDDFVRSYVSRKVPEKMIFIYGMDDKPKLLGRIEECLQELVRLIRNYDFIEVNENEIRLPFD